ncbi:MAG: hypothetical protein H8E57_07655 [Candidatus Cloacimonetes bacterium]|nr:hypothetical protein [Candidatus Cloacimonadota bacterium]
MNAIEFNARPTKGMIKIPAKYLEFTKGLVHIIVLKKEQEQKIQYKKKEIIRLLKHIQKQNVFDKIDDPVKWQQDIRNEWK